MLKAAKFYLDALPNVSFVGYSRQDIWNGFKCPLFDYNEAVNVLSALENLEDPETLEHWEYYGETFYVFQSIYPDEPEIYQAELIELLNMKLYPIGNCSWAWMLAET